nr:hypothetical protein [uncultured Devosia sp.]
MRNILTTAVAASFCALTLAAPLAGAEPPRKIDNPGRLDWLAMRTIFAATDGPFSPDGKANQRSKATLDTAAGNESAASPGFDLLGPDLRSAWELVQQQAQFAAKFTSKRLGGGASQAERAAPELSWGWQHES